MAKITLSDKAPAEAVHFSLASVDFDLGGSGKKSYETYDTEVIGAARVHEWLDVEVPQADQVQGLFRDQLSAEEDGMSAINSKANDPEAARAALAEDIAERDEVPVVIDAGKVQTEPVLTDGVAETLAADPTSKTSDKTEKGA
jgi:hypothetical protein